VKGHTALPGAVMDRILDGANPMRVLMDHKGLTQADVARLTGLSQPFVSKLARGEVRGRRDTIKALARAFGVGEDVLEGVAG
jgi:transcriptional regulator with XRE-family HTH domain